MKRVSVGRIFTYLFLIVATLIMLYPVLFLLLGAFTTSEQLRATRFLPIPNTLNLRLIARTWAALQDAYLVTLLRAGVYIVVTLFVGLIGGYIFSKLRFPGRDKAFLLLLSGLVMPAVLLMVPMYIQTARFPLAGGNDLWGQGGHGFIGQWPVLFLYGWVPPFAIFLVKQNLDMLPTDYEDAAKLDGAGLFAILFRVYGPLLTPSLAALVVVTFLSVWNDYLWPSLAIAGNPDWYPISYRIEGLVGDSPSPGSFMRILMVFWPPAFVYFLLQRYFVHGLTASGLRG